MERRSCPCCASWLDQGQMRGGAYHYYYYYCAPTDTTLDTTNDADAPPPTPPLKIAEAFGDFFVLRNAQVYTLDNDDNNDSNDDIDAQPQALDVWVGGGKIWALMPSKKNNQRAVCPTMPAVLEIDVAGMVIVPGLVDLHQHVAGGGGEAQGFASRTPQATAQDLLDAGVTTFCATLGTDTVTKSMPDLLAQTRALCARANLTGLAWLGGYAFPVENTVTGTVARDVTLLPEIVGVGELAISDHRGTYPTTNELLRLTSQVRVAGMLSNKAGVTYFHLGEDASGLQPLHDVVQRNPVLRQYMVPTHMERSALLVQQGMDWMQQGGFIDFSGWPERQRPAIQSYLQTKQGRQLMRQQLSISSDSFGSINVFDETGKLIRYSYGLPDTLLRTFMALVYEDELPLHLVLRFFCRNPATILRLHGAPHYKGRIHIGGDADLVILKLPAYPLPTDYPRTKCLSGLQWPEIKGILQYVIAGGRVVRAPSLPQQNKSPAV